MTIERSDVLRYRVKGSEGDLYDVRFQRIGPSIQASCSCQAGENRLFCKHRHALIHGDVSRVVSGDLSRVAHIREYLGGTDAEAALDSLYEAERLFEQAKQLVSARKREVSTLLGYWRFPGPA